MQFHFNKFCFAKVAILNLILKFWRNFYCCAVNVDKFSTNIVSALILPYLTKE